MDDEFVRPPDSEGDEADNPLTDIVGADKELTSDGGLKKKILVLGSGWDKPGRSDEVTGSGLQYGGCS